MPEEKKNRSNDPSICDEASGKTSQEKKTWSEVKKNMEKGDDIQTAWSKYHRSCGICLSAGLLATAIGTPALALTCPAGQEVVKVGGIEYCQPTTPITFPGHEGDAGDFIAAHPDDRGSGRRTLLEKDDRGEFPRRCTGGSNPTCTD